ncbi:MAG: hypothetical protein WBG37_02580 [Desulfobacterales bacterium]
MRRASIFAVLVCLVVAGCAGQRVWRSQPQTAELATSDFEVRLEPVRASTKAFFDGFQLSLINRASQPLEIDWAQCRYLVNRQPRGGFVFQGIAAEEVRTPPVEVVPPGQRLSKTIWPLTLMGWVPIKDRSLDLDAPGFSPGVLPEGENGLLLVVGRGPARSRYTLGVTLSSHLP